MTMALSQNFMTKDPGRVRMTKVWRFLYQLLDVKTLHEGPFRFLVRYWSPWDKMSPSLSGVVLFSEKVLVCPTYVIFIGRILQSIRQG